MFPGLFRKGPKRASKVEEQKLIEMGQKLKKDPSVVIPRCEDNCLLCKFGKEKRWMKKLEASKEDKNKLEKYSKKGPDLTKAVAATMLLAHEKKAKVLATASIPGGKISYAKKGNAGAKYLVGVQYFDDPFLRLMAYHEYSQKGYYIYSWKDNIVCTGKDDKPPKGYIKDRLGSTPYDLRSKGKKFSCPHDHEENSSFTLRWITPECSIKICERCASKGSNMFIHLSEGIASPENKNMFDLSGEYRMKCESDCDTCIAAGDTSLKKEVKEEFFKGSISDRDLIEKIIEDKRKILKNRKHIFAVGERCFGKDADAFLESLRYESWEQDVLKKTIELTGPVMLEQGTVNELLELGWKEDPYEILKVLLDDEDRIGELVEDSDKKIPRDIVREANKRKTELDELSALPNFSKLPPRAKLAHELSLAYKTGGAEQAINYLKGVNPRETRMKSIAYSFLVAIGRAESHRWKYADNEVETGEFLSTYFKKLIDSSGEEYAKTLQELLKMSGSTETIVLEDGSKLR